MTKCTDGVTLEVYQRTKNWQSAQISIQVLDLIFWLFGFEVWIVSGNSNLTACLYMYQNYQLFIDNKSHPSVAQSLLYHD